MSRTVCHSWPGFENSYKKWITLKWSKLHLFHAFRGKSPFGYWPTNLGCRQLRYQDRFSTEAGIMAVAPTEYGVLPLSYTPRHRKSPALQEFRGRVPYHTHGSELLLTLMRAVWLKPTQLSNWRG